MATPTPTPYYGPGGSAKDIFTERTFVAGDFISGVGYGIQLVLYTWCTMLMFQQRKDRKYSAYIWAYITLLLIVETIYCIVQARTVEVMYIDNRNYPGGPWAWFLANQQVAINVMFYASLFSLTFLSDLLVLWRCWVIWTASGRHQAYLVILFPTVLLLASFVMGTLWTLQSSQPGLSLYSKLPMAYGTAYYAISLGVNIVLTLLIILRLWLYRRNLISRLPKEFARHYVSLAAIIIESAALYSLFAVLFLITYAVNNPINQVFLAFASFAQQISTYLIIYRVADGSAFNSRTLTTHATTMNFAKPPQHAGGSSTESDTVQFSTFPSPAP